MSADCAIVAGDRLTPPAAAAAILTDADDRYLLQRRDGRDGIWFPGHWGLFGGAADPGETPEAALRRELAEELELIPGDLAYFTQIAFDLAPLGAGVRLRWIYEARLAAAEIAALVLHEGTAMRFFTGAEMARLVHVAPYDALALRLHWARGRLRAPPPRNLR